MHARGGQRASVRDLGVLHGNESGWERKLFPGARYLLSFPITKKISLRRAARHI